MTNLQEAFRTAVSTQPQNDQRPTSLRRKPRRLGRAGAKRRRMAAATVSSRQFR